VRKKFIPNPTRGRETALLPVLLAWLLLLPIAGGGRYAMANQAKPAQAEDNQSLLAQARTKVEAKSFSDAEALTRSFLALQDNSADGHYLLAYILSREKKARDSLNEYTRAAQLRSPGANDLKMVAVNYVLLGDYVDADRWFTKALDMNPSDAEGWYYLGRTRYNENRFAGAIDAFEHCLKLDARTVEAENNLGLSYQGLNRNEEAVQAFQTAIDWQADRDRKDAQPFLNLGMVLAEKEHPEAALPNLQQAVTIAPQNPRAHEQLGRLYLKLKQREPARQELEKAIALAPDSASLHYELGIAFRDQGLKTEAQREFDRCTQLNATHSSVETPNP
jgi:tetratricopeptide (TPR) repeat protein